MKYQNSNRKNVKIYLLFKMSDVGELSIWLSHEHNLMFDSYPPAVSRDDRFKTLDLKQK